jgi:L-fuconolactonase
MPGDLEPLLQASGVQGTVLVQSLPTIEDTDFLLELSGQYPFILGVVGWADLKADDAPAKIARLAAHPKLKSLRPMLQDIGDAAWIGDPLLDPAIAAMQAHNLRFDALAMPQHLPSLTDFAKRNETLPIVIDHAAKPLIAKGLFSGWRAAMAGLAAFPNVYCKLSGLLTEAGESRHAAALRPYAETILEIFGAARVIWGSDWPVLRLAGGYKDWLDMCLDFVPAADHAAVFGGNACSFYGLTPVSLTFSNGAASC